MPSRLTQRQNDAYEYIRAYMRDYRKPPTLQEMCEALGVSSTNSVYKILVALEQKGYIEREAHVARGIRLVDAEADPFALDESVPSLPLISRTPSDAPERLRQRPNTYISVDPRLLPRGVEPEACVIARAGDDGMNREGILKGDLVVIEERPPDGLPTDTLVAALIGDGLYVRRYQFLNGQLHLRAADRTYADEAFTPGSPECHVVGRVVALLRRF